MLTFFFSLQYCSPFPMYQPSTLFSIFSIFFGSSLTTKWSVMKLLQAHTRNKFMQTFVMFMNGHNKKYGILSTISSHKGGTTVSNNILFPEKREWEVVEKGDKTNIHEAYLLFLPLLCAFLLTSVLLSSLFLKKKKGYLHQPQAEDEIFRGHHCPQQWTD